MNGTVLVSTHDLGVAGSLREAFRGAGYAVDLVTPGEDPSGVEEPVLAVVTGDVRSQSARQLAAAAREELHVPLFLVLDEDGDAGRSAARELGPEETFVKPVRPDEVLLLGRRLIERRRLQHVTGIVGETEAIREALERVVQIAPVAATVLVTGESGTGKELVARGIHALSPRRHRPFIAVNVAALSDTLLESELFGHEKGAFTGAIDSRRGLFELADRGTIFLDEIGEMPLATQTKLLRVLEQKEFLRVGGEKPIRVDVRVIAATNQDLKRLVVLGEFRRDLYYRLNVLHIGLPPLRERREDIPLLVQRFVEEATRRHDRRFEGISDEAMAILQDYHWPGNVRELRNLVESMVVLAPGRTIRPDDIPEDVRSPGSGRTLLPVPLTGGPLRGAGADRNLRPQLEFIFRTLVDMRLDVDELRREFEAYKAERQLEESVGTLALPRGQGSVEIHVTPGGRSESPPPVRLADAGQELAVEAEPEGPTPTAARQGSAPDAPHRDAESVVVYRPGMTMEDLEREAIAAALGETGGNRRKAAERLQIGERTLYRKIRKYGLDG